ncbi:hypothetical protein HPB50_024417 [Hyalomma asiaticum]|uniref:Uncharacterized protein n=1 Tax=Hyalomma asiaticum TaxID=266040 RepID=A0ACB7SFG6_HYAAI|nr:hypothetical protein HPB50_024417 [Hyalomma asiaticum]
MLVCPATAADSPAEPRDSRKVMFPARGSPPNIPPFSAFASSVISPRCERCLMDGWTLSDPAGITATGRPPVESWTALNGQRGFAVSLSDWLRRCSDRRST